MLKCQIAGHFRPHLQVTAWLLDDGSQIRPLSPKSFMSFNSFAAISAFAADSTFTSSASTSGAGPAAPGSSLSIASQETMPRMVAVNDQLVIGEVQQQDSFRTFRCEVRNLLTGHTLLSLTSGKLIVTESAGQIPPNVISTRPSMPIPAVIHQPMLLLCAASANPNPTYSWSSSADDTSKSVVDSDLMPSFLSTATFESTNNNLLPLPIAGLLLIRNVSALVTNRLICKVNNSHGSDRVEYELDVREPLRVRMQVSSGRSAMDHAQQVQFKCDLGSGRPIQSLVWLRNGLPLNHSTNDWKTVTNVESSFQESGSVVSSAPNKWKLSADGSEMNIARFERSDSGCYQCVVRGGFLSTHSGSSSMYNSASSLYDFSWNPVVHSSDSVQVSACVRLAEKQPQLKVKFESQLLSVGERLSLKCVASGNPLPTVTWTVYDQALPENHRIQYGDYVSLTGDVVSYVNISAVSPTDGGLYTCSASNSAGRAVHSAIVRVQGLPAIRPMRNRSLLAGATLYQHCPLSGHPLQFVRWSHLIDASALSAESTATSTGGSASFEPLSSNGPRHRVYENGTLVLRNLNREMDAGWYVCEATGQGQTVREQMHLTVLCKFPFSFYRFVTFCFK